MGKNGLRINFMSDKIFIDSNIFIYTIDDEKLKQKIADSIIEHLSENGGIISTQVLQEFYNIATKKLNVPKEQVQILIERLSDCFVVHRNSVHDILRAIEISIKTQFSFWDSLIISAAIAEGCSVVYTEDLNDGQLIDGLLIKNPL